MFTCAVYNINCFLTLFCRESLDGGQLAVHVEDKVVSVRNVKVGIIFIIVIHIKKNPRI